MTRSPVLACWSLWLLVALVVPFTVVPAVTPIAPAASVATAAVADDAYLLIEALDKGDKKKLAETTPAKILKSVTKGAPVERPEPGTREEKITGADGRQANMWVRVPSGRIKKYGLLIMLHGYGGNGKQLLTVAYGKFATHKGYIIVGPEAMKPLAGKSNTDLPPTILGETTKHWWTYRSDGLVMAIVDQLSERYPIDRNRIVLSGMSM
ncbi:MAG: hypothetical protein HRU16_06510, partial [Planctomycetes bacterium]|nr:hypothetical protein [Planctomycetota bacterium]